MPIIVAEGRLGCSQVDVVTEQTCVDESTIGVEFEKLLDAESKQS